jgi:16S rRNA (cytidine1402-2'-O)-methyltransferase
VKSAAVKSGSGGELALVATPIGNLGDITPRAIETLKSADLVACEDTRVTGKLMALLGVSAPLAAYHDHNEARVLPALIKKLLAGDRVALVTDAGTPLLSDPGFRLVRACLAEDIKVTSVPGASAALTALQLSGLPCDRFLFAGFPPAKAAQRRAMLSELARVPATLIFYESPRRLAAALADMAAVLGPREASVARELTKLHEEVRRDSLADLAAHYAEAGPPRGEVTLVVGPPAAAQPMEESDIDRLLKNAMADQSVRESVAQVAAITGGNRRDIYARALALAKKSDIA